MKNALFFLCLAAFAPSVSQAAPAQKAYAECMLSVSPKNGAQVNTVLKIAHEDEKVMILANGGEADLVVKVVIDKKRSTVISSSIQSPLIYGISENVQINAFGLEKVLQVGVPEVTYALSCYTINP